MKLSFFFLLLSSCGFAPEPFYERDNPPRQFANDPVLKARAETAFEEINLLVIEPHCLSCHNQSTTKGNVDLSSLNASLLKPGVIRFGDPDGSLFYTTILEGSMPARAEPLNEELTEKVRLWILEN